MSEVEGREDLLMWIVVFILIFLAAGAVGIVVAMNHWSSIGCVMSCP